MGKSQAEESDTMTAPRNVLEISGLYVNYKTRQGDVKAVNNVDLRLEAGEKFGLVGESGSGKTTLAMAIMKMIKPPGFIPKGRIMVDGTDVLTLSESNLRKFRSSSVAIVPQAAMNALNPVRRIGQQINDGFVDHGTKLSRTDLQSRLKNLMDTVGLRSDVPELFPHELSGGMKQRVAIAMAVSLNPKLIIADEPTSALDVVVQRQVIATLDEVQQKSQSTILLVGHDMGLMAQFSDRLGVMYAGELVEIGKSENIFSKPLHPYTEILISSLPDTKSKRKLVGIPGLPPTLINPPTGCKFHPRCPKVFEPCSSIEPEKTVAEKKSFFACHLGSKKKQFVKSVQSQ